MIPFEGKVRAPLNVIFFRQATAHFDTLKSPITILSVEIYLATNARMGYRIRAFVGIPISGILVYLLSHFKNEPYNEYRYPFYRNRF